MHHMYRQLTKLLISVSFVLSCHATFALTFPLPDPGEDIVGDVFSVFVEPGDTLAGIGKIYGIGPTEMHIANPALHPRRPKPWNQAIIPKAFILPDTPREGIVINLPEMRLYYYPSDRDVVMTFPVGIGRPEWVTPITKTRVIEKQVDPEWKVPESIKEHMAEKGVELPDIMPAGPDNPLGQHAMRLGLWDYLIHGTNNPNSVGRRSSSGCIRMLPEDVEMLFSEVMVGTPVRIVNQPHKLGWHEGELYFEVHQPFHDQLPKVSAEQLVKKMEPQTQYLDWQNVQQSLYEHTGYPRYIGTEI